LNLQRLRETGAVLVSVGAKFSFVMQVSVSICRAIELRQTVTTSVSTPQGAGRERIYPPFVTGCDGKTKKTRLSARAQGLQ
jgi:hypothetical protein